MIAVAATPVATIERAPAAPAAGAALGALEIPRLGLRVVFRQGVTAAVLALGPGHYPSTRLPGRRGTVGIAGHRVTHSHPFRDLNRLRRGDRIVIRTSRRFVYRVFAMRILPPQRVWPLRDRGGAQLVLTACHPPGTDRDRLVVFAQRTAR